MKFKIQCYKIFVIIVISIFLTNCKIFEVPVTDSYKENYDKGIMYFRDKKFKEADSCFSNALRIIPDARTYMNIAASNYQMNNIKKYCINLRMAYNLGDTAAEKKYCSKCSSVEIDTASKIHKIVRRAKYENFYTVIERTLSNDTLLRYDSFENIRVYSQIPDSLMSKNDSKAEEKLLKFICENVEYPTEAKNKNIQGKVYVSFILREDGSFSDLKIFKGAHYLLNKAALDVFRKAPKFQSVKYKDIPVNIYFTIPINFKMN